jgi:hypothetical protein
MVGWFDTKNVSILPPSNTVDPIVLRTGEALLLQVIYATGANNVSNINYLPSVMWDEFTYP